MVKKRVVGTLSSNKTVQEQSPTQELHHEQKTCDTSEGSPHLVQHSPSDDVPVSSGEANRWAYKNVFGVSLGFLFVFTAFLGLQNLQSSINSSGGVGLASLIVLYGFFFLTGFFSPSILKLLGTKYTLLACFFCHLLYTLANYYPSWYTLIPASVLLGVASAPVWAAASAHITEVAVIVAPKLEKDKDHLISIYTGIFFFLFQIGQVPGNLASSLILFPYDGVNSTRDVNTTFEANSSESSCRQSSDGIDFDLKFLYILASVYVGFISTGILLVLLMVNTLPGNNKFFSIDHKFKFYFKEPVIDIFRVLKNIKMILIAPMSVFNGMEMSFAFGTFTQVFVANCFGTYQVGFTLIVLGVCSSVMSIMSGRIVKYIPRLSLFVFGATLNMICIIFLLVWSIRPSYVVIFLFAVFWGLADGIWNTMITSLCGILFCDQSDVAYSAQRIWLAVGFTLGFIAAEILAYRTFLIILLVFVLLVLLCAFIIELKTRPKETLLPCCYISNNENTGSVPNDTRNSVSSKPHKDKVHDTAQKEIGNPLFLIYDGKQRKFSTASITIVEGVSVTIL